MFVFAFDAGLFKFRLNNPLKGAVVPVAAIEAMPVPELTGISR